MQYSYNKTVQQSSGESILSHHKVLRQTYMLLAMNVLFSAFCAYVGIKMRIGATGSGICFFIAIGLTFAVSATRNSGLGIISLFALTGFLGFYLSNVLSLYFGYGMGHVVFKALIGSAIIFLSLSAYTLVTGKNFNFLGAFLFVGLIVGLLAMVGAMLFQMPALQVVCSTAFLLIFSGYVLYDTSRILHGEETNYIIATMNLFLNLINIFISLLNIISAFDD